MAFVSLYAVVSCSPRRPVVDSCGRTTTRPIHKSANLSRRARVVPEASQRTSQRNDDVNALGHVRRATKSDASVLAPLVLSCGMNPRLGSMENFVVFETMNGSVVGGGQVRPGDPGELASLAVSPEWRGRGIGAALANTLVHEHGAERELCLLCLTRGVSFYERLGFSECHMSRLPKRMQLEQRAGTLVAKLVAPGNSVVGMLRPRE